MYFFLKFYNKNKQNQRFSLQNVQSLKLKKAKNVYLLRQSLDRSITASIKTKLKISILNLSKGLK